MTGQEFDDLDKWLEEIYQQDESFFTVEYKNKIFKFRSLVSFELASKASKLSQEEQGELLITELSVSPKINSDQFKRLPTDLIGMITKKIGEIGTKKKA